MCLNEIYVRGVLFEFIVVDFIMVVVDADCDDVVGEVIVLLLLLLSLWLLLYLLLWWC